MAKTIKKIRQIPTAEDLFAYFTPAKRCAFWRENGRCFEPFTRGKIRLPVYIPLTETWIKREMRVYPHEKYYTDFKYQQQTRLEAGVKAQEHLGIPIGPGIDLGSVPFASLFGGWVSYSVHAGPIIDPVIFNPKEDVPKLRRRMMNTDILDTGLTPLWINWQENIKRRYGVELQGGTAFHGPCCLGVMLCDRGAFVRFLETQPDAMQDLLEIIGEVAIQYMTAVRRATNAPAHGLALADDHAALLSPSLYETFCLPVLKKLYDRFSPDPAHPRYYHADTEITHLLPALAELRVTDVNICPNTSPATIRKQLPGAVIHGQIPAHFLSRAKVVDIIHRVEKDIAVAGQDGGMVITVVGPVDAKTPYENILALMWATEQFGRLDQSGSLDKTGAGEAESSWDNREMKIGRPFILPID